MEESRTNILDGIKVKWQKLSTGKQRIIVIGGLLAAIGIAVFLGTNDKDKKEPESRLSEEKQAIALDSKMIERTLYGEAQKKLENQSYRDSEQERQIELMQKQIQSMQQLGIPMTTTGVTPSGIKTGFLPSGTPVMVQDQGASIPGGAMQLPQGVRLPPVPGNSKISNIPPPPGLYQSSSRYDGAPSSEMKMESVKPEADIIGGISQISNDQAAAEIEKKKSDELKKDSPRAYLPPSFMAATLISGIDAPTGGDAKKMPIPVLFRIKAPAQLPSGIRSKLTQGCFVIAEGSGNLSDERCHVRLLTIACVSKDGKAVIDQPIEGFVTDDDSKAGLKGKVVAKMGAALARSAAAGFIGGVGQAVQNSTNTYQTTPLGTTEILTSSDTTNIIRAGVGGGIAQAAEDLQKFYLDLSKQALPVVEIGGGRPVNLVISKGVNLEIKYQEVAK